MAKITISDIVAQFASSTEINNRFQQIEDELNNKVLYRANPAGETNTMSNDLDMGGYDILNGGSMDLEGLTLNGVGVTPSSLVATPASSSVTYDNTISGLVATNVKTAIDEIDGRLDTAETNITTLSGTTVPEIDSNVNDLISLSGVAENTTDLGTFTGTTITDNQDIKSALQELETAVEAVSAPTDGWELISTTVPTAASTFDITLDTATYTTFRLECNDIQHDHSGAEQFNFRLGHTGGSIFYSGGSDYKYMYREGDGGAIKEGTQSRSEVKFPQSATSLTNTGVFSFVIELSNFDASTPVQYRVQMAGYDGSSMVMADSAGMLSQTGNLVDAIRMGIDGFSNNYQAVGTCKLYGRK